MKNGKISDFGIPTADELKEINKFTRREFSADELYAFSVVLCDNDIDRDFERFTDDALEKLAELFVGKTGIFDHSHKAENQCARVFSATVETVDGKQNRIGQQYKHLKARAYMPKSGASEELILAIESGIKKEVSIGCSMSEGRCSVCGQPFGACQHRKGKTYRQNGKKTLCYFELSSPTDAYEWSFVAVPAQPKAGVVKAFLGDECFDLGCITKSSQNGELLLTSDEALRLSKHISDLTKNAEIAGEFLKSRKQGILKMFLPEAGDNATDVFMKALESLSPEELFTLYREGEAMSERPIQQLNSKNSKKTQNNQNSYFIV